MVECGQTYMTLGDINRHKEELIIPNWVLAGTGTTVPVLRFKMSLNFSSSAALLGQFGDNLIS